jgi:hypothetical protein
MASSGRLGVVAVGVGSVPAGVGGGGCVFVGPGGGAEVVRVGTADVGSAVVGAGGDVG